MTTDNTGDAPVDNNTSAPAPVLSERDQFIAMLPEELRGEGVFANHRSVADLAKSYVSAAKMVGLDKAHLLAIPKDDTPEAWGEVYSKLGRPESPDKYSLDAYKDSVSKEELAPWVADAHALGLNQKQLDGLFGKFFGQAKQAQEAQAKEREAKMAEWDEVVSKELGLAKDKKLMAAVNMLEREAGEDIIKHIEAHPEAFKNPIMVKALVALADKTGEGEVLLANGQRTNDALSPSDAKQQLAALASDPMYQKAMADKYHPQHAYYVEQRQKLFSYAYPDK